MAGKTTSAGYRLPVASSSYHEKCIAASVKAIKEASERASDKTYPQSAYRDCNVVAQERIWTEHVGKELKLTKAWERDWSFMTEYDYKGNPTPKKKLPEKASYFSSTMPSTASRQLGSRAQHPESKSIYQLELSICHRKKKTDLEHYYS